MQSRRRSILELAPGNMKTPRSQLEGTRSRGEETTSQLVRRRFHLAQRRFFFAQTPCLSVLWRFKGEWCLDVDAHPRFELEWSLVSLEMRHFAVDGRLLPAFRNGDGLEETLEVSFAAAGAFAQTHFQLVQTRFRVEQTPFQLAQTHFAWEPWRDADADAARVLGSGSDRRFGAASQPRHVRDAAVQENVRDQRRGRTRRR